MSHSEETKRKISKTLMGHTVSLQTRKKISEANEGYKHTEETKRKISRNNARYFLGKKHTKDAKRKMSESRIGKKPSEETRRKMSEAHMGCAGYWKGKKRLPFTLEHKRKISESHIGIGHTESTKQKIAEFTRLQWSNDDYRKKMSEIRSGCVPWNKGLKNIKTSKENHWNWKGGISPLNTRIRTSFEYRQWRSDVFTRDDFTCQECDRRGGMLHAHHHITSFSDILILNDITTLEQALDCAELWNINNGITYCKNCHEELHKRGA